jgi:hypothetical protein
MILGFGMMIDLYISFYWSSFGYILRGLK